MNKNSDSNMEPQENLVVENSTQGDYAPMIMIDGIVYKDTYSEASVEIDESTVKYSTSYTDGEPTKDGEINFDRSGNIPYAVLEDGTVIVQVDGEWRIFKKLAK